MFVWVKRIKNINVSLLTLLSLMVADTSFDTIIAFMALSVCSKGNCNCSISSKCFCKMLRCFTFISSISFSIRLIAMSTFLCISSFLKKNLILYVSCIPKWQFTFLNHLQYLQKLAKIVFSKSSETLRLFIFFAMRTSSNFTNLWSLWSCAVLKRDNQSKWRCCNHYTGIQKSCLGVFHIFDKSR